MESEQPHRVLSLVTTVGTLADARLLAGLVLERRLAACVQLEPGLESHYVWQSRRCQEPEVRVTAKTTPRCVAALRALFAAHHPYQLPQFLATEMVASADYAAWVVQEVEGGSP